jgi:hypothetical protein
MRHTGDWIHWRPRGRRDREEEAMNARPRAWERFAWSFFDCVGFIGVIARLESGDDWEVWVNPTRSTLPGGDEAPGEL